MSTIVGNNLKALREACKFTQNQVADGLGINRSTYSNYETGEREAPLSVIERAAELFGCEPHLILEENKDIVNDVLVTAFRIDNLTTDDIKQVAAFKKLVMNYLKMERLLNK